MFGETDVSIQDPPRVCSCHATIFSSLRYVIHASLPLFNTHQIVLSGSCACAISLMPDEVICSAIIVRSGAVYESVSKL